MRHSQTSRNYAKAFLAFVTIGMASACADTVAAPTNEVAFTAPAGFNRNVGVKVFRVGSKGLTQRLGAHTISIPAGAICDPAHSTYGQGEWDKPCTPLSRSIVITAVMLEDNAGNPYVDFQPALRFVPTKVVSLFLSGVNAESEPSLNIEYCNNAGFCIDESKTDASLVTRRLANSSVAVRRIKHFSGYMISSGPPCQGTVVIVDGEEWCEDGDQGFGGFGRRSGYMVASGLASADNEDNPSNPPTIKGRRDPR